MALIQVGKKHSVREFKTLLHRSSEIGAVYQNIKYPSQNRCRHNKNNPAHLDGSIRSLSDDGKNRKNGKNPKTNRNKDIIVNKMNQYKIEPGNLHKNGKHHKKQSSDTILLVFFVDDFRPFRHNRSLLSF